MTEETRIPPPDICVRSANPAYLMRLVLPAALNSTNKEIVAAVYFQATHEILLADVLDPGTPLARSYLVHELVHAQQFATHAHERVSCPGVLEGDAYATQALYLRAKGLGEEAFLLQVFWACFRVLAATRTDRHTISRRTRHPHLEIALGQFGVDVETKARSG